MDWIYEGGKSQCRVNSDAFSQQKNSTSPLHLCPVLGTVPVRPLLSPVSPVSSSSARRAGHVKSRDSAVTSTGRSPAPTVAQG